MKSSSICKPPQTKRIKAGRVRLEPGEEIGEHVTKDREEIIVVLKGDATLEMDGKEIEIKEGATHFIEEGKAHNVMNNGKERLEYVYVVSLLS
jgi:mannose-6-phosphate isomerase